VGEKRKKIQSHSKEVVVLISPRDLSLLNNMESCKIDASPSSAEVKTDGKSE